MVSVPPECTFHRTPAAAVRAARSGDSTLYDANGLRLTRTAAGLEVSSAEPDELADLLRRWLGQVDALRESTRTWTLQLLVHAAVEHTGYAD